MSEVYPDSLRALLRFGGYHSVAAFCRAPGAPSMAVIHRIFVRRTRSLTPQILQQIASVVRMDPEACRRMLAMDSFMVKPPRARVIVRTSAELSIGDSFDFGGTAYTVAWIDAPDANGKRTARLKVASDTEVNVS